MTNTPQADPVEVARPRFHVEGQTSTIGPRWQIWDGKKHFARFRNIADLTDAHNLCDALNTRTIPPTAASSELVERRRKALAQAIYRENSLHTAVEYGRDIPDHALDSILATLDGITPAIDHITTLETRLAHMTEAAGKMAAALDNFIYSLTGDGKNEDRCLSVDHVALCVSIEAARTALQAYEASHAD